MMNTIVYLGLKIIDAWVVLPDHLHGVWTLPPGDDDFTNHRDVTLGTYPLDWAGNLNTGNFDTQHAVQYG